MRLKVTREGGFAAQVVQKQLDTKTLPRKLQSSLDAFIKQAPELTIKKNPQLRDGYLYTVEWSGSEKGGVQFDESNIPTGIEAVVRFVLN